MNVLTVGNKANAPQSHLQRKEAGGRVGNKFKLRMFFYIYTFHFCKSFRFLKYTFIIT